MEGVEERCESADAAEPLDVLDPEDQQLNTRGAQSQLAAAKSEYEQSKAELARYTDLYQKEFISKAEFGTTTLSIDGAMKVALANMFGFSVLSRLSNAILTLLRRVSGSMTSLMNRTLPLKTLAG